MKTASLVTVVTVLLSFTSCSPEKISDETICQNIQNVTLSSNSPVTIGQTIKISAPEVGGYRIYSWTGPNNYQSQEPGDSIIDAQLQNEGWYHLNLSNPDCTAKIDSVYVDIKLQQGAPSCTIANNTCTYNNLFDDTYSSVHQSFEPNSGYRQLAATGTSPLNVLFHPYWKTHQPEDGIYETINVPSFGQIDNNYNKVFVTTTKSSVYFGSAELQNVFVSHVNNKLQVRFCNLVMGGSNGSTSFTTQASATLTEQ